MNIILDQIKCDKENIQMLVDMLKTSESKGEYRSIKAQIKVLVREIKQQKSMLMDKVYDSHYKHNLPLFEVELPEQVIDYSEMSSFFGEIT